MLRITVAESASELKWSLHGQLAGPWVEQLQTCWSTTQREGRICVIDLTNLTAIDEPGERLLQAMMNEGAQFRACGVYMTHMLQDLRQRCRGGGH